jgi:hypothetical protein
MVTQLRSEGPAQRPTIRVGDFTGSTMGADGDVVCAYVPDLLFEEVVVGTTHLLHVPPTTDNPTMARETTTVFRLHPGERNSGLSLPLPQRWRVDDCL